jgi:lipopolysaccharide/colanic/teichoic acid biosynthesis glycosyltransferase
VGGVRRHTAPAGGLEAGTPQLHERPATAVPAAAPQVTGRRRDDACRRLDGRRAADLVLAGLALVLAAPIALIAIIAIKLDDGGPVLYRQRRYGRDLRPFAMVKFRTMRPGAPSAPHLSYIANAVSNGDGAPGSLRKLTNDPRVTRVGRVLRRLSIDELPQLLNVMAGDMSIIGPRPAIGYELQFYDARHYERFTVRPGMTGLWQVSGRSRLGFSEMLDTDVEYARRQSLRLDLLILAKTPAAILGGSA